MTWLSGFLRNQALLLLGNRQHAILHAVILALLPYTAWLSVAVIALVTLRKGGREGSVLLISAMLAHFALSLMSLPPAIAVANTLLTFVPCFMAAHILCLTANWRAVAAVFFMQVVVAVGLLHVLMPDFIMAQYLYIQTAISSMQTESALLEFVNDKTGLNQLMLANYLLGLQAVGIVLSALSSLMLARSVQSKLYYPEGFKQEMLTLRGNKIGLLLLFIMLFAANQGSVLAMNILPVLMFYFLLAGLSLGFSVLARKTLMGSLLLLVVPLVLLPFVMLPVYVIFGSLDSLFNFRLYLPTGAGKRT